MNDHEVIEGEIIQRGDSFDVGHEIEQYRQTKPEISNLMSNPKALMSLLNLDDKQAENVAAIFAGAGGAAGYKWLRKYVGDELAAAAGAGLAAYIAKKFIGSR